MERSQVVETLEPGSIVVTNKAVEEAIAIGMRRKQSVSDASFWLLTNGFDNSAIEAFD